MFHYFCDWRIQEGRRQRTPPPPTGPNSFIFTHIFAKKHLGRGRHSPNGLAPYGKSRIRHCLYYLSNNHDKITSCHSMSICSFVRNLKIIQTFENSLCERMTSSPQPKKKCHFRKTGSRVGGRRMV